MEQSESPFDSFRVIIKLLTITGFYEIESSRKYVRAIHQAYRIFVIFIMLAFAIQHYIYTFQVADQDDKLYGLIIGSPQINFMVKILTVHFKYGRIRELHVLIKDPIFSSTNKKDLEYIQRNNVAMQMLGKSVYYCITLAAVMWSLVFIFKRIEDPVNASVPSYVPFDTTSTIGYSISVILEVTTIFWIGFGQSAADCAVACYYSQARTQLKIIKYNLEHIFDNEDEESILMEHDTSSNGRPKYIDEVNGNIRTKFISFVERYKMVDWYVTEISSIFDTSITCQLISSTLATCLVSYMLSLLEIFSVMFLHLFVCLVYFKMQAFIYCFFGQLVEDESMSINDAMYFSDWLSVSPRFRRYIIISMTRWTKPLTPRVSTIVPINFITFASIVNSSYRLYTFMKSSHIA